MGQWWNIKGMGDTPPPYIDAAHWRFLGRVAGEIKRRCGATMWLDVPRRMLCFGYERNGAVHAMALDAPVFKRPGLRDGPYNRFDAVTDLFSVDDVVYLMQLGKVDPKKKAAWARAKQVSEENDQREAIGRWSTERTRDLEKFMDRAAGRRGMSSTYRPIAVVNGLKGG